MPQKQVPARQQIGEKMLHHFALRSQIEIDQHIAAENNVDTLLENHLAVIAEIKAIKTDLRFEQVVSLQFLVAHVIEIFSAEYCIGVAQRVLAVDPRARRFQRIVIKVGGKNLELPSSQQFGFLFQKKHGESMRLLACRTSRAPEAKPLQPDEALDFQNLRNNHIAQRFQLGGMAEHISFANRDFVQQQTQFGSP